MLGAERTVTLKIKAAPTPETKKSLDSLQKIATNWEKVFGLNGDKPVKNQERQIGLLTRAWRDLGSAIKNARENFKQGFDVGSKSLSGVKAFTSGIEGATKRVLNLKNAIAATAIGGAAIWGIKQIFEQGTGQQRNLARVKREFGDEAKDFIDLGNRVGFRSGIQGDDAAAALVPLGEQLQAIQKGARFRGMKRALTEDEAEKLRFKNLAFGADLLQRIQTLSPDIDSETLGRVLGDALAGPEGIKSLIGTLHLSKRSKVLSAANEKGEAYKALTPEEQKRLGITKKGQFLEQGDLVNLLLERSGVTDKAAEDMRKTFGFQTTSVKAQLMDTIGDIGSSALDALNDKLGKGATLAESLHDYLASDDGKKTIGEITDGVVTITESIVSIAKQLPAIGSWLKEHKTILELLATGYLAAKAAPGFSALGGGLKAAGAGGTGLLSRGAVGIGGIISKAVPVAAVGVGAYLAGRAIDEKFGLSDKLAGGAKEDKAAEAANRSKLAFLAQRREALTSALEAQGIGHGLAVRYAAHPDEAIKARPSLAGLFQQMGSDVHVTTNLVVDGQVLAKVTEKHMTRNVLNRTANGAAPVSAQ